MVEKIRTPQPSRKTMPPLFKMTILLRQGTQGNYLTRDGGWTLSGEDALAFSGSEAALTYCERHGRRDVELRDCFPDARYDFSVHPFREQRAA